MVMIISFKGIWGQLLGQGLTGALGAPPATSRHDVRGAGFYSDC